MNMIEEYDDDDLAELIEGWDGRHIGQMQKLLNSFDGDISELDIPSFEDEIDEIDGSVEHTEDAITVGRGGRVIVRSESNDQFVIGRNHSKVEGLQ